MLIAEISKAVIKKEGKYLLLLKRAAHSKSYPNLWDFPGGKHEPGETPAQSVVRETREETSLDIVPGPEAGTASYEDDHHNLLFHYFTPESVSGEFRLSPDHLEFRWERKEGMGGLELHPSVKIFFDTVIS